MTTQRGGLHFTEHPQEVVGKALVGALPGTGALLVGDYA